MLYRMTPSVRHRVIEVHYFYYITQDINCNRLAKMRLHTTLAILIKSILILISNVNFPKSTRVYFWNFLKFLWLTISSRGMITTPSIPGNFHPVLEGFLRAFSCTIINHHPVLEGFLRAFSCTMSIQSQKLKQIGERKFTCKDCFYWLRTYLFEFWYECENINHFEVGHFRGWTLEIFNLIILLISRCSFKISSLLTVVIWTSEVVVVDCWFRSSRAIIPVGH